MKIKIELSFGSDFQKECNEKLFVTMLETFKTEIERRHKKNKVKIEYENRDDRCC